MSQLIQTIAALARVGSEWVELGREETVNQYSMLTGMTMTTRQDYEIFRGLVDFDYAGVVNEGDDVVIQSLTSPFDVQVSPLMIAMGYEISKQARHTDLYNKIKNPAKKMGINMIETRNQRFARLFTLGFTDPQSGGTTTLDDESLFDTDHPIQGGTAANRPSADLSLSEPNVATALTQYRTQVTHMGKPRIQSGKVNLVVAPANEFEAKRIASGPERPGTTNRDKNVFNDRLDVVVMDYIQTSTITDAWYLVSDNKNQNPLTCIERIPTFFESDYTPGNQMFLFVTGEEYVYFARDWRGVWGTNP